MRAGTGEMQTADEASWTRIVRSLWTGSSTLPHLHSWAVAYHPAAGEVVPPLLRRRPRLPRAARAIPRGAPQARARGARARGDRPRRRLRRAGRRSRFRVACGRRLRDRTLRRERSLRQERPGHPLAHPAVATATVARGAGVAATAPGPHDARATRVITRKGRITERLVARDRASGPQRGTIDVSLVGTMGMRGFDRAGQRSVASRGCH